MMTVVIEHVALNELPDAWRAHLSDATSSRVTIRIEEEPETITAVPASDNPLFGLWHDREDLNDVAEYARQLRAPRQQDKG
jgi:hypothetical protein